MCYYKRKQNIGIHRFCALCGETKNLENDEVRHKVLYVRNKGEIEDMGYMCELCYRYLGKGCVFRRGRGGRRERV